MILLPQSLRNHKDSWELTFSMKCEKTSGALKIWVLLSFTLPSFSILLLQPGARFDPTVGGFKSAQGADANSEKLIRSCVYAGMMCSNCIVRFARSKLVRTVAARLGHRDVASGIPLEALTAEFISFAQRCLERVSFSERWLSEAYKIKTLHTNDGSKFINAYATFDQLIYQCKRC